MYRQLTSRRYKCNLLLPPPHRHFSSPPPAPTLSPNSCVALLKACRSKDQLKQIHAQVFRVGLDHSRNVLDKLVVCCTDPSLGDLQYAERILHSAHNRTLLVYNLLIKAFAKAGNYKKSILLFHKLREEGLSPDNFTYPFVFKAIGGLRAVREGLGVHGHVVKAGMDLDPYVGNSLMDLYGGFGRAESMLRVFDGMPERDVVSWNVMISSYVRCGKFSNAVDAFRRMWSEGMLSPDEATVVSTLSACTSLKMLELGVEIHRYIDENLDRTLIMSNALLDMYSKCGSLSTARQIFNEMQVKNVICWTSMITGYINVGEIDAARELFDRSPSRDVVLWTAMINGYVQFNRFDEAMDLFQEMQTARVRPDKYTAVALLTGCAQTGALKQGRWIHGYIEEHLIKVDAIVGTALIDMYAKCGCIGRALDVFRSLQQKDTASWTSIICGLAMNGKAREAIELFNEMRQVGFKPDDITFIGVLSACSHGGLVDEGRWFFNLMKEFYMIEPKLEHYGCLVDLLGRGGLLHEAEELIKEVPAGSIEVAIPLYGALLSACRVHGNVDIGERMAQRLVGMESGDSSVHTLLANIYASCDRWGDVMRVRRKMKDLGVRKVPGCSSIEVDGVVHEFLVRDPSHPKMDDICSVLDKMVDILSGSEAGDILEDMVLLDS
ncbi:pentatricopeptide repeat-containing protein At1g31430 [Punica granatum]|uniref:Uncharacterized protein n=2 Tax=Punica granatum TaxID=22663 RepID=A0A218XL03_PUNGR|nr:pentatricopeptide repeat-containing protein At1g31430 [Punica granatum]OWM85667.1 hypothetical protein CDL15_Pgr029090 [Punica granatum]PKI71463.1 hypothetical protein CRG98_008136 [Punica granatum]